MKNGFRCRNKSAVPVQSDTVVNLDLAVLPSPKVNRSVNTDAVADHYRSSATIKFEIREALNVETAPDPYASASKD
jgi:hypothetical protein